MTKIFNDPTSCIFSSYLRCWTDPPGPRSNQDDRLASVPYGVRGTSRRFFAAMAVGGEFVYEMCAATLPARAPPTSCTAAPNVLAHRLGSSRLPQRCHHHRDEQDRLRRRGLLSRQTWMRSSSGCALIPPPPSRATIPLLDNPRSLRPIGGVRQMTWHARIWVDQNRGNTFSV